MVSKEEFEKGDPSFVDERILKSDTQDKKKSLYNRIFGTDT